MKTSTTLLALAGALAAQAQYLNVISVRSGSPIHYLPLSARNQRLYLGGETASYCPEVVEESGGECPPGNTTTVEISGCRLSMGSIVPGGQSTFVDPSTGAVQYTIAHSASMPEGAITEGWSIEDNVAGNLGRLSYEYGLIACPQSDNSWQVFAQLPDLFFISTCLGFDALYSNSSEPSAWQYT